MSKLAKIMSAVNGASFIGLDTTTTPVLTGGIKNPQQGLIQKHTTKASIMVFTNKKQSGYQNMINRRLAKEGKQSMFKVGERKWGTRLPNLPIVEHKGEVYLEVIFLKPGKTHYTLNNKPIVKSKIIGLNVPKPSGQDGLEDQVIIRTFKVASINKLTVGGFDYTQKDLI